MTAGSPVAIGFTFGLLAFGLTDGRHLAAAQVQRVRPTVGRVVHALGRLLEEVAAQRAALLHELGPCTRAPVTDPPLVARLAAQPVTSVDRLSIAELARREQRQEDEVRAVLRGRPAFEVVRGTRLAARKRYQRACVAVASEGVGNLAVVIRATTHLTRSKNVVGLQ